MRLHLAAPDDRTAGVQDDVAGLGLGVAQVVSGGRVMPVPTEVGVVVHFEYLAAFGFQCHSLLPCGLEVLHEVDYRAPMRIPQILREAGVLMHRIGHIGTSAVFKEAELSHNDAIVEALVERRGGGIVT